MADAEFAVWQRMEKQGRRTIECLVKKGLPDNYVMIIRICVKE